jgi:S1-C subfamily serine protease
MQDTRSLRSAFARLAFAAAIALAGVFVIAGPRAARAEWKDMNAAINATNFIVANQCSGTLISLQYKLVLTNDHCLTGYIDKVEKEETDPSGKIEIVTREVYKDMELKQVVYKEFEAVGSSTLQATIVAHAVKYDLALLRIKADSISQTIASHVLPADKTVARGDRIYVVGNPLMLDANLTEGVISSTNRTLHWNETNEDIPYYGVDAGVNPGNSGGALYNADGELIGVPAAGVRGATGLGFAIPAKLIRKILSENCYEDVWNNQAAEDHATCMKKRLDNENAARAKAGLPPKEAPKEDSLEGGLPAIKPSSLVMGHDQSWLDVLTAIAGAR